MKKKWKLFRLDKEAVLLDSGPFILKTFLAIGSAYALGVVTPVAQRDMISVLFGLILTLEPTNITGLRRGKEQFVASLIGALITAAIVAVLGVNPVSVGLSVAMTLFVCLKVNWRDISPVALFTSIYMTQNMQLGLGGEPSIWLTFQLRMIALALGVIIAVVWNFVFSLIQYRRITYRRLAFLVKHLLIHLAELKTALQSDQWDTIDQKRANLAQVFNDIDWIKSLFEDMLGEGALTRRMAGISDDRLRTKVKLTRYMRMICHLLYDAECHICDRMDQRKKLMDHRHELISSLDTIMDNLGVLKRILENQEHPSALKARTIILSAQVPDTLSRIFEDVKGMNENTLRMFELIERERVFQ